jgi:cytochrome P450
MSSIGAKLSSSLSTNSNRSLNAKFIKNWAMRVNIAAIFGDSFDSDFLSDQFAQFVGIMGDWFIYYFIFGNFIKYLPIPSELRRRKVTTTIKDTLLQDLEHRKKTGKTGAGLISSLLSANFPEAFIIDEAITFLFAGYDTTSTLLVLF